jgi:GGDEF domain-containing protein
MPIDLTEVSDDQLQATADALQGDRLRAAASMPIPHKGELADLSDDELDQVALAHQVRNERVLAPVRQQVQADYPAVSRLTQAVAFPRDIITGAVYGAAQKRLAEGTHDDADLRNIAVYEHEHAARAASEQSWPGFLAGKAMELPSQAAGLLVGGAAADAAAPAVGATGTLGRAALQTALTPNLYAERAIANNTAAGRDPFDPTGMASGYALGLAQMLTLKAVGGVVDKALPATSIGGRVVVQGLTGPFAQAATDVVTSAAGLDTGYGAVGLLLQGKFGDALKHAAGDALTFAAFGAMHGAPTDSRTPDAEQPNAPGAASPEAGGPSGIGPGGSPNTPPPNAEQPAGLPNRGRGPVFDTFVDALNHLAGLKYSPEAAGNVLRSEVDRIKAALRKNPDLTRSEAAKLYEGYGDGPVKRFAMALVDTLPEKSQAKPQNGQPGGGNAQDRSERARPAEGQPSEKAPPTQPAGQPEAPAPENSPPVEPQPAQAAQPAARSLFDQPAEAPAGPPAGVERRKGPRPKQSTWDAIKAENPTWTTEQIGREAARRADALSVDPQTGLGSRAQYAKDAAEHGAHTSIFDVPSMHEVNNHFGDQAGDALLAAHGAAMREAGIDRGYRKGGDELAALFDSAEEQQQKSAKYQDILNNTEVTWQDANGTTVTVKGFGAAVAHGETPQQAQASLPRAKEVASERGFRSRGPGQLPPGLAISPGGARPEARPPAVERGDAVVQAPQREAVQGDGGPAPAAQADRATPADLRDRLLAGDDVSVAELAKVGLTKQEAHTIRERLKGRSLEDISNDGAALIGKKTRERVRQYEAGAVRKLGIQGSVERTVNAPQRAERAADMRAAAKSMEPGEDAPPARQAPKTAVEIETDRLAKLTDQMLKESEQAGGALPPERQQFYADQAQRIRGRQVLAPKPSAKPLPEPALFQASAGAGGLTQGQLDAADRKAAELASKHRRVQTAQKSSAQSAQPATPRKPPLRPAQKKYVEFAREADVPVDALHSQAAELKKLNAEDVDSHNDMLRTAWSELKPHGMTPLKLARLREQDATKVPGIDEVAEHVADRWPSKFAPLKEHPSDTLFSLLQEGIRKPITEEEAYSRALSTLIDNEVTNARLAAAADGAKTRELEEALRSGEETGEAEGAAGLAEAEHTGDVGDFDPADFGDPAPVPESLAEAIGRPLAQAAADWLRDETATFTFAGNAAALKETVEKLGRAVTYTGDALARLSGRMAPATTRLNPRAGEAVVRYAASPEYGKLLVEHLVDQVLGLDVTDTVDHVAGAVLTEMRLQHMRDAYLAKGDTQAAADVQTLVGKPGSPLTDQARFLQLKGSPKMREILDRWKKYVVPVAEAAFRKALGMADTDPIDSFTQIPGLPVTLKAVQPNAKPKFPAFTRGKQGNLSNPKARKLKHGEQATGTADVYEQSLKAIMDNMIAPRIENAAKAEMYRELHGAGLLTWTREGQGADFGGRAGRELPGVRPPRGTQANLPMQTSAYVHPDAYGEVRRALAVDEPGDWVGIMRGITSVPTVATLASFVEVATHALNLSGGLFGPKMNLYRLAVNVQQRVWDRRAFRAKLLPLAKEGAVKPHGVAGGTVVNQVNQVMGLAGAKLPEGAKYLDPTYHFGNALKVLDDALRVTAAEAYDALAAAGHVPDTATGRRDFLNQMFGQYNAKMQNALVALARWSGIGPFATAGTTMTARAVRALFGGAGVRANGWKSDARIRAEVWGRLLAMLAAGAALNFAAWKRWDGDDSTPIGSVKVGERDGKSYYVDHPAGLILRRGLRALGALAILQGMRHGTPAGTTVDNATKDALRSVGHPFMGPSFQLAYEAVTGEDLVGKPIAPKVTHATTARGIEKGVEKGQLPPGSSQMWSNVKGAAANANPVISALLATDEPDPAKKPGFWERVNKLLGPVGMKAAKQREKK